MRCPVCDALHRENSQACEAEATAILKQRYDMIQAPPDAANREANRDVEDERHRIVVSSRHRQLEIALRLKEHRSLAHSA